MPRNVEIKAKIHQLETVQLAAEALAENPPELIEQEDIFFNVENGRFKLRFLSPSLGQLIYYHRDDVRGPKTSNYHIVETNRPNELRSMLDSALGEKVIVRKSRQLYLVGRTRIHIDVVEGLGDFLELEVMLEDSESPEAGEAEALALIQKLGIKSDALVEGAYADLLEQSR